MDRYHPGWHDVTQWWNLKNAKVEVLARGDEGWNFVATYTTIHDETNGNGAYFTVLRVQEYTRANNKPFILTAGTSVYAGVCE